MEAALKALAEPNRRRILTLVRDEELSAGEIASLGDTGKMRRWTGAMGAFGARPGGAYRTDVIPSHIPSAELVEVAPPHRLVYTWGWESDPSAPAPVPPGSTTVEYELTPEGA